MPYSKLSDLPPKAKEIWMAVFNAAYDEYSDEKRSIRTAWAAVKQKFHKNDAGEWIMSEHYDLILESKLESLGDGNYKIQIIKNGLTRDGKRYYPVTTLKEAINTGLYDNVKMYVNHKLNTTDMHRNMHDYVGTIIGGSTNLESDGSVSAVAHFHNKGIIDVLNDEIARKNIGLSQSASTRYYTGDINKKSTKIIEKIKKIESVDLVPIGNAFGYFLESMEENMDYSQITLDEFMVERPDLVNEIKETVEVTTIEVEKEPSAETIEGLVNQKLSEIKEQESKLNEYKKYVQTIVDETELPKAAKDKIMKQIDYSVENLEESVKEICEAELSYVNSLLPDKKVTEIHKATPSKPVIEEDVKESYNDKFMKRLKDSGFNKEELEKISKINKGE